MSDAHRKYVGGADSERWYGIGKLQYHFLVSEGLLPEHAFLDIACGSLRLGQYLIPCLQKGNYFGLEINAELISAGLEKELLFDVVEQKQPHFMVNDSFNVSECKHFDFAIAQSLLTHLIAPDIQALFKQIRKSASVSSKFYFTFFEGESSSNEFDESHPHRDFHYSFSELIQLIEPTGWKLDYIGDWNHPVNQKMVLATVS